MPVALVVGVLLSAVNQGSIIVAGQAGVATWVRVGVNFAVPFMVASVGFLSAARHPPDRAGRRPGRWRAGAGKGPGDGQLS